MEIDFIEVEDAPMDTKEGVIYLLLGGRLVKVGKDFNQSTKMYIYGVFPDDQLAFALATGMYAADRAAAIKFREEAVIVHLGYPAYHPEVIKEMEAIRSTPIFPDWQSNFRGGKVSLNLAAETWLRVQAVPLSKVFGKRPWTP